MMTKVPIRKIPSVNVLRKRVLDLKKQKMHPQKSPEWFKQRQTRITASDAASCLYKTVESCQAYLNHFDYPDLKLNGKQLNSFKSREEFIVSKCLEFYGVSTYTDNHSTLHGKRFEEVAQNFYCNLKNTEIIEFGLLNHHSLDWLAASPDGITKDGVMLEIKCPNVRKIKPNIFPIYYFTQIMIQLQCCDLYECDYLECSIKEVSEEEWYDLPDDKYPGIILRKPGTEEYIYPPRTVVTTVDYIVWIGCQEEYESYDCVFYYIDAFQILNVKRDDEWFEINKKYMKETHDVIRKFQNDKEAWERHYKEFMNHKNKKFLDFFHSETCSISG